MIMMRTIDFFFCVFFFFFFRVFRFFHSPAPLPPYPASTSPHRFFPPLWTRVDGISDFSSYVLFWWSKKRMRRRKRWGVKEKEKRAVTRFERELGSVSESEQQGMEGEFSMPWNRSHSSYVCHLSLYRLSINLLLAWVREESWENIIIYACVHVWKRESRA